MFRETSDCQVILIEAGEEPLPEDIRRAEQTLGYQHRVPGVPALPRQVGGSRVLSKLLLNLNSAEFEG